MARAAARKAAAERRRRRLTLISVAAGVLVVLAGVALAVVLTQHPGKKSTASKPGAGVSASASASASAPAGAFPSLPPGADAALRTKPTVTAGSDALTKLTSKTLVAGTGPAVKAGQTVTVNYVGVSYQTGKEFDSSWKRSQTFPFKVGAGDVIQGWDQGLVGVKVGSRVQLDIPSNLAYGDHPTGDRPAGPLRFVVDVLGAS